jgi:hypothetical protein
MTKTPTKKQILEARHSLWREGDLNWKLEPPQKELYDSFQRLKEKQEKVVVWLSSRRYGKSFSLLVIAFEQAIKKPGSLIKYAAPLQDQVREILDEIIPNMLEDCPEDMKPVFKERRNSWYFPNGSKIQMVGVANKRYVKLRGGSCDLAICDEAGFIDDLKIVVNTVLLPTTTTTNGKILLATTPPDDADHDFSSFEERAATDNNLVIKTIDDYFKAFKKAGKEPTRITKDEMDRIVRQYGGKDDPQYLREYMCERVSDTSLLIIPEFDLYTAKRIITEWKRPAFFDAYTSMDVGGRDLTGILFAYYDFLQNKVIIEDEGVIDKKENRTDVISALITDKEAELWFDKKYQLHQEPFKRISDTNNVILLNDLNHLHGVKFAATRKDNSDAARNEVRIKVRNEEILINPRCVNLIAHLKYGKWNRARTSYARSEKYGHYDLIDALVYLIRNINYNRNPYPQGYDVNMSNNVFTSRRSKDSNEFKDFVKTMFQVRKIGGKKRN